MIYPPHLNAFLPSLKLHGDHASLSAVDLRKLLYLMVLHITVDEDWYVANYDDVRLAIEEGHVVSATEHYRETGYLEGRFPFLVTVDHDWYLRTYPDVAEGIAAGEIASAAEHFFGTGYLEGRLPRPVPVDARWYEAEYERAKHRIRRGEVTSAEEDFTKSGYASGFLPFKPARKTARRGAAG